MTVEEISSVTAHEISNTQATNDIPIYSGWINGIFSGDCNCSQLLRNIIIYRKGVIEWLKIRNQRKK